MAKRQMFFGCRDFMDWIPCPRSNADMSRNRYTSEVEFMSGGSDMYTSMSGPKTYDFDFGFQHEANIRHLMNVDSGAYGLDVYFLDPFAMNTNILPIQWSNPYLAKYGAPSIRGVYEWEQSTVATVSNTYGYPVESAAFGLGEGAREIAEFPPELWIPVPTGYTFHIGVHGHMDTTPTNAYVGVTKDGDDPLTSATHIPFTDNNSATLMSTAITPGTGGVTLRLYGDNTETMIISGMVAQILPTGSTPTTGTFISGRGNSGCRIVGGVEEIGYSAAMDWMQYHAKLREYGDWNR